MKVVFRNRSLERCFVSSKEASQTWGQDVARRYVQRVALLLDVERFDDLFTATALDLDPLLGDRMGQYAMTLQGRWRLIVTAEENTVTVEEVTNHYGD
jgi:plasmid maintenance system killer protein